MADSHPTTSGHQSGIYAIRCLPTGKVYVGSSTQIQVRMAQHKSDLACKRHKNIHLQRACNKYGPDCFSVEVLEYVESSRLVEREQHFIDCLSANDSNRGFNIRKVAHSNKGFVLSPETRAKISRSLQGRKLSLETRAKIAESNRGKTPSRETREKLSRANQGKVLSEDIRLKISLGNKGKRLSTDQLAKLTERNQNPETRASISRKLTGITRSPETRAKMAAAKMGKTHSEETRRKMSESARNRVRKK